MQTAELIYNTEVYDLRPEFEKRGMDYFNEVQQANTAAIIKGVPDRDRDIIAFVLQYLAQRLADRPATTTWGRVRQAVASFLSMLDFTRLFKKG